MLTEWLRFRSGGGGGLHASVPSSTQKSAAQEKGQRCLLNAKVLVFGFPGRDGSRSAKAVAEQERQQTSIGMRYFAILRCLYFSLSRSHVVAVWIRICRARLCMKRAAAQGGPNAPRHELRLQTDREISGAAASLQGAYPEPSRAYQEAMVDAEHPGSFSLRRKY